MNDDMRPLIDPKTLVWGFGNHEPVAMYERGGILTTGGVPGNARWLRKWHDFFDSEESAALLARLGINILHCRFYKGMGWEHEKDDFPAVRRFAENCRKHGIKVLAYVQYATLYHELMRREVPDLRDWAIVGEGGKLAIYPSGTGGQYWRWLPCPNSREFFDYTCKVLQIALDAGCFDGVMFDNVYSPPCRCPRCTAGFREFLRKKNYDFLDPDFTDIPPFPDCRRDVHDPVVRAECEFRMEAMQRMFAGFRKYIKERSPQFLMTGNYALVPEQHLLRGVNAFAMADNFDIVVSQSGNEVRLEDGCVITQVPELKLARALGAFTLPLNDNRAETTDRKPEFLAARLCESLFGGGIPVERSAMRPLRGGAPDLAVIENRKQALDTLARWREKYAALFDLPHWEPIGVVWSRESVDWSAEAVETLVKVFESLMRNQLPFRVLPTDRDGVRNLTGCTAVIVPGAKLLSDRAVEQLRAFPGRLFVAGRETGDYDEEFRQREADPFADAARLPLAGHEVLSANFRTRVRFVRDDWKTYFPDLPATELAPESFADWKCDASGNIRGVLLTCAAPFAGGRMALPKGEWTAEPFGEAERPLVFRDGMAEVPTFTGACVLARK